MKFSAILFFTSWYSEMLLRQPILELSDLGLPRLACEAHSPPSIVGSVKAEKNRLSTGKAVDLAALELESHRSQVDLPLVANLVAVLEPTRLSTLVVLAARGK